MKKKNDLVNETPLAPTQKDARGQMEPTPRPWKAVPDGDCYGWDVWPLRLYDNETAEGLLCEADAKLIVRAVNSHDDLLEALKEAMAHGTVNCPPWVAKARIAIARAEGREVPSVQH